MLPVYAARLKINMGKDYCAIKDCHNRAGQIGRFGKSIKLHHLPKNKALRSAWVRVISRKNYQPSKYTQVCSDHFPNGEGRTWEHVVPTLYLPQKKNKIIHHRTTATSQNASVISTVTGRLDQHCQEENIEVDDVDVEVIDHDHHS